jgi:hypothetical protein
VEANDFLLNGAGRNEAIHRYGTFLPDAVGTVAGLVLDGGIPPRVEVDDVIGSRQVEAVRRGGLFGKLNTEIQTKRMLYRKRFASFL